MYIFNFQKYHWNKKSQMPMNIWIVLLCAINKEISAFSTRNSLDMYRCFKVSRLPCTTLYYQERIKEIYSGIFRTRKKQYDWPHFCLSKLIGIIIDCTVCCQFSQLTQFLKHQQCLCSILVSTAIIFWLPWRWSGFTFSSQHTSWCNFSKCL